MHHLSNEELLIEKKKLQKSKFWYAAANGFLMGIFVFGTVSWIMSEKKNVGVLVAMLVPLYLIVKLVKANKKNKELEDLLKQRGLND